MHKNLLGFAPAEQHSVRHDGEYEPAIGRERGADGVGRDDTLRRSTPFHHSENASAGVGKRSI